MRSQIKSFLVAALTAATLAGQAPGSGSSNNGYYRPVPAQPQAGPPCGHYGTPPCQVPAAAVKIPDGASAEQIFQLGQQAFARKEYSLSARYMERAAELGHTRAQAAIGLAYVNGKAMPPDLNKAVFWLTKAADKGHKTAQAQLGDLLEDGDGVPVDYKRAFRYHQLSAAQGWWQAELRLGLDYELGWGTPRNRATAIQWLTRAMNDGHDGFSQQLITMLQRSDTPASFASVDAMAAHFGSLIGPQPGPSGGIPRGCRDAMGRIAALRDCVTPVAHPY